MSVDYRLVQWTPFKKRFDLALVLILTVFMTAFIAGSFLFAQGGEPGHPVQIVVRALGVAAFGLLTAVLCIGPLARLSPRFKPLLANRRHAGVVCFFLALAHAAAATIWYHGFSATNPLVSLLTSNPRYGSIAGFPFESLGFAAIIILFIMAATSHDYWNRNLGASVWKALHMGVYIAYGLIVAHMLLGVVQFERADAHTVLTAACAALVSGLHLFAGWRERARDLDGAVPDEAGWTPVCAPDEIAEKRAKIIALDRGERVAVFRHDGKISAISNACRHQNGPLGEGRIVDGCVVCPWHGYQYRPEDGASPPPFLEKVATYRTRLRGGVIEVHADPLAPGVRVAPTWIDGRHGEGAP